MLNRRMFIAAGAASAFALDAARALEPKAAEAFVTALADDVIAIVKQTGTPEERSQAFLKLFRENVALPQIGRFTAGLAWREMSPAQQEAYLEAFERYAAKAYVNRLGEYSGQTLVVTGSQDAGQRGVLVNSLLKSPGEQDIRIDWLVSDRGGSTQVVDVVGEGVSLSISQREEFAAMLEKRGGDIDRFIADLGA